MDFAESGPRNENPSDRREGFCCFAARKDQSTAKHSVIRLHLLQGPAAEHFLTLKFMSEGKVPVVWGSGMPARFCDGDALTSVNAGRR